MAFKKFFLTYVAINSKFFMLLVLWPTAIYSHYELTEKDKIKRSQIVTSIAQQSTMYQAVLSGFDNLSFWTPTPVKRCLLHCGSYVIKKTLSNYSVRNELKYLVLGSDNAAFTAYDSIIKPLKTIPEHPISSEILNTLFDKAKGEQKHWHKGKMSGGIYDGSDAHMASLAQFFNTALKRDEHNRDLFFPDEETEQLAVKAFQNFQAANPLHNLFPLAVKSMREIGYMMASLFGKQHAIVSSGGEEALRIGLRTLKNRRRQKDKQCLVFTLGDTKNFIKNSADTLNIRTTSDPREQNNADFVVIHVTKNNLDNLNPLGHYYSKRGIDMHFHFDNSGFRRLFLDNDIYQLNKVFLNFASTKSVSFDSDGLFYQGIAATIFTDVEHRFDAFEAHIDWPGGIYPGINGAGSLPGIDFILTYLSVARNGRIGLAKLAKMSPPHFDSLPLIEEKYNAFKNGIINQFLQGQNKHDVDIFSPMQSNFLRSEWQILMKNLLIDTILTIFDGSSDNFSGQITSGGTESIRIIIQTYFNRFKRENPEKTPLFLMTEKAHIAFDRHIKDLDSHIVRIKEQNNVMDKDDLEEQIKKLGVQNIAAIIISTPNYPIGTADNIRDIAPLAHFFGLPLHVDSCLGGFVMQFLKDNPVAINLSDKALEGITSWSADIHKYGSSQKGLSFVGFRKRNDLIMPPGICKQRSSTQLEVGLACLLKIGFQGYQKRAQSITELAKKLSDKLKKISDIEIIKNPSEAIPHFVIAFHLKDPLKHLTYTAGRFMDKLGWHLSAVGDYTLHIAITNAHTYNEKFLSKFMSDLKFVVDIIRSNPNLKQNSSVGLYGIAASPRGLSLMTDDLKNEFLSGMLKLYAENLVE